MYRFISFIVLICKLFFEELVLVLQYRFSLLITNLLSFHLLNSSLQIFIFQVCHCLKNFLFDALIRNLLVNLINFGGFFRPQVTISFEQNVNTLLQFGTLLVIFLNRVSHLFQILLFIVNNCRSLVRFLRVIQF